MFNGEEVFVVFKNASEEKDAFGKPLQADERLTVKGVLVSPSKPEEILASNRMDGSMAKFTLYFPKGFNRELRGAEIEVRGVRHRVIGDPAPYDESIVPGSHSMAVYVEAAHG